MGNEELKEVVRSKLRIGVQWDTEVVTWAFGDRLYPGAPGEQIITQVYASAVSVSYSRCMASDWMEFASLILDAAYEATLYIAVENALRNPDVPLQKGLPHSSRWRGVWERDVVDT